MTKVIADRTSPRFAIVGCGLIGRKRLNSLDAGQLSVACDREISRAEALVASAGKGRATTDVEGALHDPNVEAVIVSVLNSSLAPIAREAIKAGKHTLIEKPAGVSVAEIDELIALATENNVQVRVGYNHRFHPAL